MDETGKTVERDEETTQSRQLQPQVQDGLRVGRPSCLVVTEGLFRSAGR